jgi:hypothetical protein
MNNTLTVIPNVNLVSNIGYGPDASNCLEKSVLHSLKTKKMLFPLQHPRFVSRFILADDFTEEKIFSGTRVAWKEILKNSLPKIIFDTLKV